MAARRRGPNLDWSINRAAGASAAQWLTAQLTPMCTKRSEALTTADVGPAGATLAKATSPQPYDFGSTSTLDRE
jgi:hypothetical protein